MRAGESILDASGRAVAERRIHLPGPEAQRRRIQRGVGRAVRPASADDPLDSTCQAHYQRFFRRDLMQLGIRPRVKHRIQNPPVLDGDSPTGLLNHHVSHEAQSRDPHVIQRSPGIRAEGHLIRRYVCSDSIRGANSSDVGTGRFVLVCIEVPELPNHGLRIAVVPGASGYLLQVRQSESRARLAKLLCHMPIWWPLRRPTVRRICGQKRRPDILVPVEPRHWWHNYMRHRDRTVARRCVEYAPTIACPRIVELHHRLRCGGGVNIGPRSQVTGATRRRTSEEIEQQLRLPLERASALDKTVCAHPTR